MKNYTYQAENFWGKFQRKHIISLDHEVVSYWILEKDTLRGKIKFRAEIRKLVEEPKRVLFDSLDESLVPAQYSYISLYFPHSGEPYLDRVGEGSESVSKLVRYVEKKVDSKCIQGYTLTSTKSKTNSVLRKKKKWSV